MKLMYFIATFLFCSQIHRRVVVVCLVKRLLEVLKQRNYIFKFYKYCAYCVITNDNMQRLMSV